MLYTKRFLSHFFPAACALILTAFSAVYGQLRPTGQLTSNNIMSLAGNGDTVWIATERGFNYQTSLDAKKEWLGFEADNLKDRFCGMAFGGGGVAALIYKDNFSDSIGFWHFDHKSGRQQQRFFRFSRELREDGAAGPVGGIIYGDNKFWAPFRDGGMVSYDPQTNRIEALRPDQATAASPENVSPPADKSTASVLAAAAHGNFILVTTPSKIWTYGLADKKWDTLDVNKTFDSAAEFISFNAAFHLYNDDGPLYALIATKSGGKEQTAVYRYGGAANSGRWSKALNNTPLAIFTAVKGQFYALFENNRVIMFVDTLAAADPLQIPLEERLTAHQFRSLLANAGDDPDPEVNDILFLPRTDSVGTLLVATSSGLYFSKSANPVTNDYSDMTIISHARQVKSGESYALPGIIRRLSAKSRHSGLKSLSSGSRR